MLFMMFDLLHPLQSMEFMIFCQFSLGSSFLQELNYSLLIQLNLLSLQSKDSARLSFLDYYCVALLLLLLLRFSTPQQLLVEYCHLSRISRSTAIMKKMTRLLPNY